MWFAYRVDYEHKSSWIYVTREIGISHEIPIFLHLT
jgi:hypothetical protein